jgi:uncharacterized protein (TIGR00369 family)
MGTDDDRTARRKMLAPDYRERLFALINASAFIEHMAMSLRELEWGRARFHMEAAAFRLQPFGVVHGGNLATLIDSATFWACFLAMGTDEDALTSVDLKLNYLAPARVEALDCVGTLIKAGKTLSYAEASVTDANGRLVAHGTSTLMRLPRLGIKLGVPMWSDADAPSPSGSASDSAPGSAPGSSPGGGPAS